ncbi:MAG: RidA family protein [Opitutae bacterium]|jgi:enamine deaminase RidA (YjgF/YER057c/UK114 family)|nr:RidA family protein [Opitutae bacterium]MBT5715775.1 RidA family protein [Opitutae bacterium]
MNIIEKLLHLNLEIPSPPRPAGLYKTVLVEGRIAQFSGHLPIRKDGTMITGKVGIDLSLDEAVIAARQVGLNILASLQSVVGDLDRVDRVYKLLGMVNADPDFTQHPMVINGCSQLFFDLWGRDCGVGVRSAYGVSGLPLNASVEIEGAFLLKE